MLNPPVGSAGTNVEPVSGPTQFQDRTLEPPCVCVCVFDGRWRYSLRSVRFATRFDRCLAIGFCTRHE
eukprot:10374058-Alexandrium_andersonii.AAC.1